MIVWLDAHLAPALAAWLAPEFGVRAAHVRDLGLRHASDETIWDAARLAGAVVMTKDRDFVERVRRLGPPPRVIWITVGNTSNARLRVVLGATLRDALDLLAAGEALVEISEPR